MATDQLPVPTKLNLSTIGLEFKEGAPDDFKAIVLDYFSIFAEPSGKQGDGFVFGNRCIDCGEFLTGMLGTFQWDLCYGEFRCGKCRWPGRGCHSVKDRSGSELFSFGDSNAPVALQYLPEFVTQRKTDDE